MRTLLTLSLLVLVGCKTKSGPAEVKELKNDDEKTVYSLGLTIGRNLGPFKLTPAEVAIVQKGLSDQITGAKPMVDLQTYGPKISELAQKRMSANSGAEKEKSTGFLEQAAKEPNAQKTESGLIYTELTAGKGDSPKASDTVKVHYRGTLIDGTEFDSSYKRNEPAQFPLNGVIPCWTEGVQKMKPGGKAKLVCPSGIAYGDRGSPPTIPGGATLVFEVELLDIVKS
jgi:FKBP-type peptidyl-prolyl cis-trans isomerase FkpA